LTEIDNDYIVRIPNNVANLWVGRRRREAQMAEASAIPGYGFGAQATARSPLSLEDLELLKQTVLFTEEDEEYLRLAGDVLEDQVDEVLDLWYGFVGSHPHLIRYFAGPGGEPNAGYLERVRERFKRWILDTCRRHTRAKKNQTDGAEETPEHIPSRYIIAFVYPITATIKQFLVRGGHAAEEVEKMHDAWFKSVVLQVALWSQPYTKEGDF
jgi:hypothetical protein